MSGSFLPPGPRPRPSVMLPPTSLLCPHPVVEDIRPPPRWLPRYVWGPGEPLRPSPTLCSGHRCCRRTLRSPALLGLPPDPLCSPSFSRCLEGAPGFPRQPQAGTRARASSPLPPAAAALPRFSKTRRRRSELRAGWSAFRVARGRRAPGTSPFSHKCLSTRLPAFEGLPSS